MKGGSGLTLGAVLGRKAGRDAALKIKKSITDKVRAVL
jgi:hypothetical protein